MKTTINFLQMLLVLALFVSCGNQSKDKESGKDVKQEIQEATDATIDYASKEFNELVNNFDEFKSKTNSIIDSFKDRTQQLDGELQRKYNDQIAGIKAKQQKLQSKIEKYKKATGSKKDSIKKEIEKLKKALDESIQTFENELEKEQN